MPRLRSRPKENVDGPEETKKSLTSRSKAGSRVIASKKKGNDNKLIAINTLATLKSPVLRDRTNLTLEPTKVNLLKKGIEDKEAGDAVTANPEMKATRTRQKKSEELKNVKGSSEEVKARTRGRNVDVEKTVNAKASAASNTAGMIATDEKDDTTVDAVKKASAERKDNSEKKRPMTRRARLLEQKPETKVSTLAKTRAGAAKDKLIPQQKDLDDKSEDVQDKLSSKEADDDKSEESSPEVDDDKPQAVNKKSAGNNKRARKIKEVKKPVDVEEKLSNEADDDKSDESSPEIDNDKPQAVNKKSSGNNKRVRKTKEVKKSKDVEEKISNEADDNKSEDSSPEVADDEPKVAEKKVTIKKSSMASNKMSLRTRKTKKVNKSNDVEEKSSNKADRNKSGEDSSPETADDNENGQVETQETVKLAGKKFFKTINPLDHYKMAPSTIMRSKAAGRGKKARVKASGATLNTSVRLRQTSLKESLANLSKRALRARPPKKNNENSSPKKKIAKKKGPVYKEIIEEGNFDKKDNPDQIYEFSYDLNDSQERIPKRKKRVRTRRAPIKKARAVTITINTVENKVEPPASKLPEKINSKQQVAPATIPEEHDENSRGTITITAEVYDPPSPEAFFEDEPYTAEEIPSTEPKRPVVVSCQELSGENRINWTTTPVQPKPIEREPSGARQYSQRPSAQMKTMMNTSLIRRSLSPISKAIPVPFIEETGSPWRLIPCNSFSRVKNVFQSTPQGKKFTTLLGKASAVEKKAPSSSMEKIEETNNENLESKENNEINNSKSPRKFGTEISNTNNVLEDTQKIISPTKTPRKFGTDLSNSHHSTPSMSPVKRMSFNNSTLSVSPRKKINSNKSTPATSPVKKKRSKSVVDEAVDKENSVPNCQSPTKTPRKNNRSLDSSMGSPFKGFPRDKPVDESSLGSPFKGFPRQSPTVTTTEVTEELQPVVETQPSIEPLPEVETQPDLEPQPGPSGVQISSPPADTWKLKQSNLNRFLNLPEKPTSSRISTSHGIFDDLNSSPIEANKVNKKVTRTEEADVANAFGFDDNDYESDDASVPHEFADVPFEPPVLQKVPSIDMNTKTVKALIHDNNNEPEVKKTTRITAGTINKILKSNKNNDEIEKADKEVAPVPVEYDGKSKPTVVEPAKFLDTFDLSTEVDTTEIGNQPVGLFLDTEPVVHYKEPPIFSYKRVRRPRLMSCGDTEDESDSEEHKRPAKRRKLNKAEREHNKKIDEWAKNVNTSFEEIDNYDLLVE